jgi:mono/diheme cytochrome c family protein
MKRPVTSVLLTSVLGLTMLAAAEQQGAPAAPSAPAQSPARVAPPAAPRPSAPMAPVTSRTAAPAASTDYAAHNAVVKQYCVGCHSDRAKAGGLTLASYDAAKAADEAEITEKIVRKLRAKMMPPSGAKRPDEATMTSLMLALEHTVDRAADPGRSGARVFQRLNRAEYGRAVRDLLALDIDVSALLPADTISAGFDNVADSQVFSPTLMESYLRAASKVTTLAVGDPTAESSEALYRVPKTASQMEQAEGAPLGTRGGLSVIHTFPADGDYSLRLELHGNACGFLFGGPYTGEQMEVSVDGERVALLDVNPKMADMSGGMSLKTPAVHITAGPHRVTAAFIQRFEGPVNDLLAPIAHTLADTQIGVAHGVTTLPHLKDMAIVGPARVTGVSDTESRRKIFTCRPTAPGEEQACASRIVRDLATQAFRRPVSQRDFERLMTFYKDGRAEGDFEMGVASALEASSGRSSACSRTRAPRRWPRGLPRSGCASTTSTRCCPTRCCIRTSITRWARRSSARPNCCSTASCARIGSLLDLLTADYTFVNERMARHYGIPMSPAAVPAVPVPDDRRGILGHGSILVLTSVADRTSPVMRGKWVMEVLLGSPPPPPPPNVPALERRTRPRRGSSSRCASGWRASEQPGVHVVPPRHRSARPGARELRRHRQVAHQGQRYAGRPSGVLYDGTPMDGPAGLRDALLKYQDVVLLSFTERLMTYALGRRLTAADMPTVRAIVRDAGREKLSDVVVSGSE